MHAPEAADFRRRPAVRAGTWVLALQLLLTVPAAWAQPVGIPSMGSASSSELSPALERTLGNAIMEQGRRDPDFIAEPDVEQYLTDMGRRLAHHVPGGAGQPITVFAMRDPQINAFALPGGYVGINSGLVTTAETESELASVIAHEIGHVSQRHIARGMTRSAQSSAIVLASLAGALLAAMAGSGDLAMGVATFGQAAAVDRQLGFSRQAEQEADRIGYEMMRRAGYDPRGMARMFSRLGHAGRLNEGTGGNVYTSTHPLSVQRLSDIENRIRSGEAVHHQDSGRFWYLRARLRVIQAVDSRSREAALAVLRREAEELQGTPQAAARYGLAWAAWQKKDTAGARQELDQLGSLRSRSPEVASLDIALSIDAGELKQAVQQASEAWARWPEHQGVAQAYASALQKAGQDSEAVVFLRERIGQWPDVAHWHQMLARSHERLGERVQARRAMASYYEMTGALPTAVEQLQQARGLSHDFYVQSELDMQIRALKDRILAERSVLERFRS